MIGVILYPGGADLRGAGVQHGVQAVDRIRVEGDRAGIEVGLRHRFEVETAELVRAADQRGRGARTELPDRCGDVADGIPDPVMAAAVLTGPVEDADMIQRHFARTQHEVDGLVFVNLDRDFLAAAQQVSFGEGVAVGNLLGVCVPGTTRMQPLLGVLGVKAIHAVMTSALERPQ